MTKTAKISQLVIVLLIAIWTVNCFVACNPEETVNTNPNVVFPQSFVGYAKSKSIYLVSIGQSGDINQLSFTLKAQNIAHECKSDAEAKDVKSGSVVFVVVGCSLKGMEENETTKENELERAQTFIDSRNRGEIDLVAWHIGGMGRRGSTSDSLIEYIFQNVDLALFTANGNYDFMLNTWAEKASVPHCQFTSLVTVVQTVCRGIADV